MTAFIVVVPTPYVTIAAADGRHSLDLPAGTCRVTARSEARCVASAHKNKFGRDYPSSAYEKR